MTARHLIVVDCETTSLDPDSAVVLEVAAIDMDTGDELYFAPFVTRQQLADADPDALRINRYYERGVYRDMLTQEQTRERYDTLSKVLARNTFAGCNPAFDARLIERQECDGWDGWEGIGRCWHHRLADLAAYAAPALGLAPNELVGLAEICQRLGVELDGEHTALGDARATAECFRRLTQRYTTPEAAP
ncbi:exonuclease domain-containing protein [Mycobacterium canetti]|uniref:3'-5' exonuclease n=1 Tax=Mycobacterium canetti TaxID=78331 RepID=UPI0003454BD9|nr:exonuclease domain-containing protein [Mycobacterium canetti]